MVPGHAWCQALRGAISWARAVCLKGQDARCAWLHHCSMVQYAAAEQSKQNLRALISHVSMQHAACPNTAHSSSSAHMPTTLIATGPSLVHSLHLPLVHAVSIVKPAREEQHRVARCSV
jgi:hypothetical protein